MHVNFGYISNFIESIMGSINRNENELLKKITILKNGFFDAADLSQKMELADAIANIKRNLHGFKSEVDEKINSIKSEFSTIDSSGGFNDEQLLAYKSFNSCEEEIRNTLNRAVQKVGTEVEETKKIIDVALTQELSKLTDVPKTERLPKLDQLQQGGEVLKHFKWHEIAKDGNCLFGSISYILNKSESLQNELRQRCCDHLMFDEAFATFLLGAPTSQEGVKDYFEGWCVREGEASNPELKAKPRSEAMRRGKEVIEKDLERKLGRLPTDMDLYREFMRQDKSHGGDAEIAVLTKLLQRPILVFRGPKEEIEAHLIASVYGKEHESKEPIIIHNMPGHYNAYVL